MTTDDLKAAIQQARAGNKSVALPMLKKIVQQQGDNEHAWLWLAECVEQDEQKKYCYQQVYRINPYNILAHAVLEKMNALPPTPPPQAPSTPQPLPQTKPFAPKVETPDPTIELPSQPAAAQTPQPTPPEQGKWQIEEVVIPSGLTGPKKEAIRQTVQDRLLQGWLYIGHDLSLDQPDAIAIIGGINILTPLVKLTSKTHLGFARNPAVRMADLPETPYAIRPWIRPGVKRRFGIHRHPFYYLKNLQGRILNYCVINDDKKETGCKSVTTLYADESLRQPVAEARDDQLFLFPGGSKQPAGSITMVGNRPTVTAADGRRLVMLDQIHVIHVSFILPPGFMFISVEGEVFRLGLNSRLSDEDELLVRLYSVVARFALVSRLEGALSSHYSFIHVIE